ncbi:MAG: response regulator [Betaproteobacteria bacterium]|nr:response regulator [Betaproteobacteria bacterium]
MKFYVVDDDPDLIALLERVLLDAGHQVETSTSSRRALAEIPTSRPDCVITDLMMPEMDGFELTRELRRRVELADMKIIVLSAKSYDFDRRRAKELGADGYLTKPIQRNTVIAQIGELVSSDVVITYWGVHGTLPVPGPHTLRYGGNTPCITVTAGGEPLFVFDCGSGIKKLSDSIMASKVQRFSARIFISHPHWDHINTVPFFAPLYVRGNEVEIFGPYQGDLTIERVVSAQMEGVYFPVTVREFGAHIVFRDLREESLQFGAVRIDTMLLSHPGYCLGYRLSYQGRKVCYITDNELYLPGDSRRDERYIERLIEFVEGADLLVTDTTYRDHEYPSKADWGHSCVSQVADLAARARVKRLHLFHHDPDQTDDDIDLKVRETRDALEKRRSSLPCDAPAEGSQLTV